MTEPTDDLRLAVREAIYGANGPWKLIEDLEPFYVEWLDKQATAAIAAYRAHPDGAAKDWLAGRDAAAEVAETKADKHGWNYHLPSVGREIAYAIRALTPPEDKP